MNERIEVKGAPDPLIGSGRSYNTLLMSCTAQAEAEVIYTWNFKRFQVFARELALLHGPVGKPALISKAKPARCATRSNVCPTRPNLC